MNIEKGQLCFVTDSFFERVKDPFLKVNHEDTRRPHYFAFPDPDTGLYWLVPCSSRVEKYKEIISKRNKRVYQPDAIKIVRIYNKEEALLFQDMFPVSSEFIESPYVRGGQIVRIQDKELIDKLETNAKRVVFLLRKGVKFTPTQPNATRIEKIMLGNIEEKDEVTSE